MTSLFETLDKQKKVTRARAASDLLMRRDRAVDGMRFASLDEPEVADENAEERPRQEDERADAMVDEMRLRLQEARADALSEASRRFEMELETKLVEERKRLDKMRLEFARDRQRFFAAAESQVVKLALDVARKILHRDAVAEGLPLRATVKAALARVQDGSSTILRVPECEVEAWKEMFCGSAGKVQVLGDERMLEGECVLETSLGRVELGVDAQMDEVERGFGELMQEQGY